MLEQPAHPLQPLERRPDGRVAFKINRLVRYLLDCSRKRGCGMNELAEMPFSEEDFRQFYQLIGYDVDGYFEVFQQDDRVQAAEREFQRSEAGGEAST